MINAAGQMPGFDGPVGPYFRSGDPAARQVAMNRLRDLRDQARAQAASQFGIDGL